MRKERVERLESELASLEGEFRETLIRALEECAAGRWGLLSPAYDALGPRYRNRDADKLAALGETIEETRRTLGIGEPFELYSSFKDKRARKGGNALGDVRLAAGWLATLKAAS